MIKGAQRRIVVLNTKGSDYFESAYFVMKNEAVCTVRDNSAEEMSMLKEADRIVSDALGENNGKRKRRKLKETVRPIVLFVLGTVSGAVATWLIFMLDK